MGEKNIELKLYHGTNRKRGQKFIKNQSMEASIGEKHWLGDGIYLFEDDFWAYWWIRELYKEKYFRSSLSRYLSVIFRKILSGSYNKGQYT